ncbi:MAG: hypothetical protein QXP42_03000 [Candidatus Micrarchaeia archaeon]
MFRPCMFFALFLVCGLFAESMHSDIVQKIGIYVEEEERQNLSFEDVFGGVVVGVDGKESFLLQRFNDGYELVLDEKTATEIFEETNRQYYRNSVKEIHEEVERFEMSREPEEGECKLYLGIDRFPCKDIETCEVACYTPLCKAAKQNTGFISAMLEFSEDISEIDGEIGTFISDLAQYEISDYSQEKMPRKETMENIIAHVDDIKYNKLFASVSSGGYFFCRRINYNITPLNRIIALLEELRTHKPTIEDGKDRALNLINETKKRLLAYENKQQSIEKEIASLRMNASAIVSEADERLTSLSTVVVSAELEARMEEIKRIGTEINQSNITVGKEKLAVLKEKEMEFLSLADALERKYERVLSLSSNLSAKLIGAESELRGKKTQISGLFIKKQKIDERLRAPVPSETLGALEGEMLSLYSEIDTLYSEAEEKSGNAVPYFAFVFILLSFAALIYAHKRGYTSMVFGLIGAALMVKKDGGVSATETVSRGEAVSGDSATGLEHKESEGIQEKRGFSFPNIHLHLFRKAEKTEIPELKVRTLFKKGDAYYAVIGSVIRDQSGMLVPDGTTVSFSIDHGKITESAKTVKGRVYAKMGFAKKPESAIVTITCGKVVKKLKLVF